MLRFLRTMKKGARCPEGELEPKAGKLKKLNSNHDIFAAVFVQAQAQTSNSEQEEDAPGEEAQAVQAQVQSAGEEEEFEEDAAGEEASLECSEPGIGDAGSEEDVQYKERSSEDMYAENLSEVAAVEEEQYDNYSFQCQDDLDSSRSATSSLAPRKLTRIADLHPCLTGRWQTRGCVAHKGSVRPYKNWKGAGIVFCFEMADEHGGEIRVVCFNDQVKKFFDKVREGEWIVLSRGLLQAPNPEFNRRDKRACEVVLAWNSSIERGDSTVVKETTEGSRSRLALEVEGLRRELAQSRRELAQLRRELALSRRELAQLWRELAQLRRELAQSRMEVAQLWREVAQLRRELRSRSAQSYA